MVFKSKEVGIKNLQEVSKHTQREMSFAPLVPLRQEGHEQRQTSRHPRVDTFDARRVPSTLGEARSDPLQCARGDSLQEEGGVTDFSEADRDAVEAREDFWSVSGFIFLNRHHVMHREQLHVPKESSFPKSIKIH